MKYLAVAVEDDKIDFVVKKIDDLAWTRGVKQVVLDQVDFSEVETLS